MSRYTVSNHPGHQGMTTRSQVHPTQPSVVKQNFFGPTVNVQNTFEKPGTYDFNVRFRGSPFGNGSPAHIPASPVAGNGKGHGNGGGNGHGNGGGNGHGNGGGNGHGNASGW